MGDQIRVTDLLEQIGEIGSYLIKISNESNLSLQASDQQQIVQRQASDTNEITTDKLRDFARIALQEYQHRFKRRSFFNKEIFGEPAWDILLDLFVSRVQGVRVSVKSVCIASQVPLTTALRWIAVLESEGLLVRTPDTADARRIWIELSDLGLHQLFQYFSDEGSRSSGSERIFFSRNTQGGEND